MKKIKTLNFITLISIFVTFVNSKVIEESPSTILQTLEALNTKNFNNINVLLDNALVKRQDDGTGESNSISCQKENMEYVDCYGKITKDACKIRAEERCKKIFK